MFKPIEIPEQKSVEIPGFIRKAYDILCVQYGLI